MYSVLYYIHYYFKVYIYIYSFYLSSDLSIKRLIRILYCIVGKFAAACFGCIFLGIFTESITVIRRHARELTRGKAALLQNIVMSLLYTIQVMFGYFSMLVAMTYQVELFVCIVVGLGLGHAIFNFKPAVVLSGGQASQTEKILRAAQELDDVVDPCCQYLHLDEDSSHSQASTTQQLHSPTSSSSKNTTNTTVRSRF